MTAIPGGEPRPIIPALAFYTWTRELFYPLIRVAAGGMLLVHGINKLMTATVTAFATNVSARRGIEPRLPDLFSRNGWRALSDHRPVQTIFRGTNRLREGSAGSPLKGLTPKGQQAPHKKVYSHPPPGLLKKKRPITRSVNPTASIAAPVTIPAI